MSLDAPGPVDASSMGKKQLREELIKRGETPSNFLADDVAALQVFLDAEYEEQKKEMEARADLARKRREEEEAQLRERRIRARQVAEEQDQISADPRMKLLIELVDEGVSPPHLTLRANPVAIRGFVKAIPASTSLTSLDLCRCKLEDDVAVALAGTLSGRNTTLLTVDLTDNFLTSVAAKAFGEMLQGNTSLRSLSLEQNQLCEPDCSGLTTLAESLRVNATLTSLNLFNTGIGVKGGEAIARCLPSNNTLVVLQLSPFDGVPLAQLAAIAACLQNNSKIYQLERAEEQKRRKQERAVMDAQRKADEAAAAAEAEQKWLEEMKEKRELARKEAARQRVQEEIDARKRREEEEQERRQKALLAEQSKKKKGKKGKKGKKKK